MPLTSMIAAAHEVLAQTGNRAEVVELTEAEWAIVEKSEQVRVASRFCFHEERPARDVVSGVTGLTVEVGRPRWQR
jgi:predicted nucleotidyltransferase